jgi:hypothetical protein
MTALGRRDDGRSGAGHRGVRALSDGVKLTVSHDGFRPGSPVLANISSGWPRVLSSLKTLLAVGDRTGRVESSA